MSFSKSLLLACSLWVLTQILLMPPPIFIIDALFFLCVVAVCLTGGLAHYPYHPSRHHGLSGSTTPTLGHLPLEAEEEEGVHTPTRGEKKSARSSLRGRSDEDDDDDADISDDLEGRDQKRKQGLQPSTQHKRRRTNPEVGGPSTSTASTPSSTPGQAMAMTSAGVQHGETGMDVVAEGTSKSEKYVTRSKLMDTTSLAGVNAAVIASRKERANPTVTKVDSSTSTGPSPQVIGRPPSPSEYPFPTMHAHSKPRKPLVTLEDWEDLKELWNRCLEVVDTEDPVEVLPLLRGIIHECSWFLHEFEDPSVIFMTPRKATTPM